MQEASLPASENTPCLTEPGPPRAYEPEKHSGHVTSAKPLLVQCEDQHARFPAQSHDDTFSTVQGTYPLPRRPCPDAVRRINEVRQSSFLDT